MLSRKFNEVLKTVEYMIKKYEGSSNASYMGENCIFEVFQF